MGTESSIRCIIELPDMTLQAIRNPHLCWRKHLECTVRQVIKHMHSRVECRLVKTLYLAGGVVDMEAREEALSNGLFDNLEHCRDHGLGCNDGRQSGHYEHGPKDRPWQGIPKHGAP